MLSARPIAVLGLLFVAMTASGATTPAAPDERPAEAAGPVRDGTEPEPSPVSAAESAREPSRAAGAAPAIEKSAPPGECQPGPEVRLRGETTREFYLRRARGRDTRLRLCPPEPVVGAREDTPTRSLVSPESDPLPPPPDPAADLERLPGESLRDYALRKSKVRRGERSDFEKRLMRPLVLGPAAVGLGAGVFATIFTVQLFGVKAELDHGVVGNRSAANELIAKGNRTATVALGLGVASVAAFTFAGWQYAAVPPVAPAVVTSQNGAPKLGIAWNGVLP